MKKHTLKAHPIPFQAMWDENKLHDVRRNDRDFNVGDLLTLREITPASVGSADIVYTGREMVCDVTYITRGGEWELPEHLCVLSVKILSRRGT